MIPKCFLALAPTSRVDAPSSGAFKMLIAKSWRWGPSLALSTRLRQRTLSPSASSALAALVMPLPTVLNRYLFLDETWYPRFSATHSRACFPCQRRSNRSCRHRSCARDMDHRDVHFRAYISGHNGAQFRASQEAMRTKSSLDVVHVFRATDNYPQLYEYGFTSGADALHLFLGEVDCSIVWKGPNNSGLARRSTGNVSRRE